MNLRLISEAVVTAADISRPSACGLESELSKAVLNSACALLGISSVDEIMRTSVNPSSLEAFSIPVNIALIVCDLASICVATQEGNARKNPVTCFTSSFTEAHASSTIILCLSAFIYVSMRSSSSRYAAWDRHTYHTLLWQFVLWLDHKTWPHT